MEKYIYTYRIKISSVYFLYFFYARTRIAIAIGICRWFFESVLLLEKLQRLTEFIKRSSETKRDEDFFLSFFIIVIQFKFQSNVLLRINQSQKGKFTIYDNSWYVIAAYIFSKDFFD